MLALRGVRKSFGAKQVLDGIDLDVPTGESLVVIGGSGTGKSVLLRCILGLEMPDAGAIMWNGAPLDAGFMAGFGIGELAPAQRTRRRLYSLYLALVMIVETRYRGHTDTEIYDLGRRELDAVMAALGHDR